MPRCLDEIIRASGNTISKAQAEQILTAVEKKFERYRRSSRDESFDRDPVTRRDAPPLPGATTPPDPRSFAERLAAAPRPEARPLDQVLDRSDLAALQQAGKDAHADAVAAATLTQRRQQLQVLQVARSMAKSAQYGPGHAGVLELLQRDVEGRGNAESNRLITTIWGPLEAWLKERGEWGLAGRAPTREAIIDLLNLLRDPELTSKLAGKERTWSNTERLAYQFRLALELERSRKNNLGADIKELQGYTGPQSWDPLAIKWYGLTLAERFRYRPGGDRAGQRTLMNKAREAWVEDVFPLIDRDRYRDDTGKPLNDADLQDVLREIWLTIGDHGAAKQELTGAGGANVESMGAHRELHFKDGASWYEANQKFGNKDFLPALLGRLNQAGRDIALMETFGPWLERGYQSIRAWAAGNESVKSGWGTEGKKLVDNYYAELAGRTGGVDELRYTLAARVMQDLRSYLSATLLGSLPFSQIPDLATTFAMAKYTTNSNAGMFEVLKILNPTAKADRELARLHGFLTESMIHDIMRQLSTEGNNRTRVPDKLASLVMTVSGAQAWTDSLKLAAQMHFGYWLAKTRKSTWDNLEPAWRATLERYHLDAGEWDLLRQNVTPVTIRGMEIITPAELFKLQHPAEMTAKPTDVPALRLQMKDISVKAVDLMLAEADIMVLTPDAFTRSKMKGGTQAGTLVGELARSTWMFKSFSLAMKDKVLSRLIRTAPGNTPAFKIELFFGLLGAGALAVQLQNVSQGKNPQNMNPRDDPKALKFWLRSAAKSGGMGIFGDILFQDYGNAMEGIGRFLGGPTAAALTDLPAFFYSNINAEYEGKDANWGADTVKLMRRYTPLANLWYARTALDHLLWYRAQEGLNPGYLQRMEHRLQRQHDTTWWWAPSATRPEGPPDLSKAWHR